MKTDLPEKKIPRRIEFKKPLRIREIPSRTELLLIRIFPSDISNMIVSLITPLNVNKRSPESQFKGYCALGYYEMAQRILDNIRIGVGGLSITCQLGFVDIAKIIVQKMDAQIDIGIDSARENGFTEIVKSITHYSTEYKTHGFYQACANGHLNVVSMLVEKGVKNETVFINGMRLSKMNRRKNVETFLQSYYDREFLPRKARFILY